MKESLTILSKGFAASQEDDLTQITAWSQAAHTRTPYYIHAARTTWRWGCNILAVVLAVIAIRALLILSEGPALARLLDTVLYGIFAIVAFVANRLNAPEWYAKALRELGGAKQ